LGGVTFTYPGIEKFVSYGLWYLGAGITTGSNADEAAKGNYHLRTVEAWDSKSLAEVKVGSQTAETILESGGYIDFAVSYVAQAINLLYKVQGQTEWQYWRSLSGASMPVAMRMYNAYSLTDVQYATGGSAPYSNIVKPNLSVSAGGTASVKGDIVGGTLKLNVLPTSQNFIVNSITIDGFAQPEAVKAINTVWESTRNEVSYEIVGASMSETPDVVVEFVQVGKTKNVNLTLQDASGNKLTGIATFNAQDGGYSPVASVTNGEVNVKLEYPAVYDITIGNYAGGIVTIDENGIIADTTIILQAPMFDVSKVTNGSKLECVGNRITYSSGNVTGKTELPFAQTDIVYAEMIIEHQVTDNTVEAFGAGFYANSTTGVKSGDKIYNILYFGTRFVPVGTYDSNNYTNTEFQLRMSEAGWTIATAATGVNTLKVKLVVKIVSGTLTATMYDIVNGTQLASFSRSDNYTTIGGIGMHRMPAHTTLSSIVVSNTIPA
jgi:hypothetical protein